MGRPPCCDKSSVKRGLWTAEEDAKILHYVSTNGPGNWTSVPKKAGLKRCGKSCRLRWTNYLRPDLKHDNFTPQEEEMIVKLHSAIGSRWSLIAMQLPGRTDNDVKNHWNTKLRKKLVGMGIDPVTHKPFSQILTDYGNIGGLPKTSSTRTGSSSLNKDLKYSFMPKTEPSSIPQLDHDFSGIGNHPMMTVRLPTIQDGSFFNLTNHPMIFRDTTIQDSKPFNSNNQTLELLAQLQAIKLATQASSTNCNIQETSYLEPHFFNEGSSSSSSSSSSSNIRPENSSLGSVVPNLSNTMPSSSFSWSEFLLDEAFIPPSEQAQQQEEEFVNRLSATNSSTQDELKGVEDNQKFVGATTNMPNYYNTYGEASTSTGNSFVEAILDRDSQMLWEFPNLLEEPFY